MMNLRTSDFDYKLPKDLIAQYPADRRDNSRLLVLNKKTGAMVHKKFYQILEYIKKDDLVIFNDSRVFPAKIFGKRSETGGSVEILLCRQLTPNCWEVMGKGLKVGAKIIFFGGKLHGEVDSKNDDVYMMRFNTKSNDLLLMLEQNGEIPLPPYIAKCRNKNIDERSFDKERYQTIYAKNQGSIAAPTAGLHFTRDLIKRIEKKEACVAYLTLHVGMGTFKPIKSEYVAEHKMHKEYFSLPASIIEKIAETKKKRGRIIAVGTTTTRVLESIYGCSRAENYIESSSLIKKSFADNTGKDINIEIYTNKNSSDIIVGHTNIFIYPPYKFKCVDAMITNFHLPKSTLLMLVASFGGKNYIDKAYREAIKKKYHFYSYGDAMFVH